jgi:hypothetical protein
MCNTQNYKDLILFLPNGSGPPVIEEREKNRGFSEAEEILDAL